MARRIVVIGAGSAGASACFAARKQDRKAEITCLNAEPYPTYSRCALPFVIGGEIDSFDTPTVFGLDFFKSQKIDIRPGVKVESVDAEQKQVKASGDTLEYDSLVLAMGGRAKIPSMPGAGLPGVFVLRARDDGAAILELAGPGKTAVVNGASFIALEAAEALHRRGAHVICVIRSRALRSMIDKQFSRIVEEKLSQNDIEVLKDHPVGSVIGTDKAAGVMVNEKEIPAGMVIMCTGTAPDVEIAVSMGVSTGKTGGIKVNDRMETGIDGIFAAGDCVESTCFIRGTPVLSGLGTIATRQGMVAGANAAGADEHAPPVLGASVMKLFDIEIGAVGLTEDFAANAGFDVFASTIKYPSLPHYYPGGTEVHVRLLADKNDGRLIGGQVIVNEGAAQRVNMLSLAILNRMTAEELHMADFCYSPPCSDIWAAEAIAAGGLATRLRKSRK